MDIIIALLLLIFVLILGIPVPFAFMLSVVYLIFVHGYDPSFMVPYGFGQLSSVVLLAIPLFIMAGGIMDRGGIGSKLIDIIDVLIGRVKGALGIVAIVSCAVFGSMSGSAAATVSSIGSILFPRMEKQGYPVGFSATLIAHSSVLALLIPPSSLMILYAWVGQQSVLAAFLATVIPGIILIILLCAVNFFLLKNNKNIQVRQALPLKEYPKVLSKKTVVGAPALAMPFIILGGIYSGVFTPTEAAAVAVFYSIPIAFFVYRKMKRNEFFDVLVQTAITTGVIMIMVFAISILSRMYIMENVPSLVLNFLQNISENPLIILLLINLFMVIIGMLMDDVSAVLLCASMLLPVVTLIDVDPIHFAAILGVNLGMGNITPPTAPLLYLSGRISGAKINDMLKPTLIMIVFAWLPTLLITTFFPQLSLFLPNLLLK